MEVSLIDIFFCNIILSYKEDIGRCGCDVGG